jgi:predicted nucleic acid-binding protein
MIVVDTSVWIDLFRGTKSTQVETLVTLQTKEDILIGDLILLEILQGATDEHHADRLMQGMSSFAIVPMLDPLLATKAAQNYRLLRGLGVTIRKTADLVIGTYCIEGGHRLLHNDRDFQPMERHLGLLCL